MNDYRSIVGEFATLGSEIIRTDPRIHYESIGRNARRPLEPGFIPVDAPPLLTAVSYYPNESDIDSEQFRTAGISFDRWGQTGRIEDYEAAYNDWLSYRSQIPFYRSWEEPLYSRLGIGISETAWLPLIKCPLPSRSSPDVEGIDVFRDLDLLWRQLNLVKPALVLVQSAQVGKILVTRLPNLPFIREAQVQKIPQQQRSEDKARDIATIAAKFAPIVAQLRLERERPKTP